MKPRIISVKNILSYPAVRIEQFAHIINHKGQGEFVERTKDYCVITGFRGSDLRWRTTKQTKTRP